MQYNYVNVQLSMSKCKIIMLTCNIIDMQHNYVDINLFVSTTQHVT